VKKAVNMALRAAGKRNRTLSTAAVATDRRLAESPDASVRWIGRDALKELTNTTTSRRLGASR
jgi:3-methyladenine DNA glycosylase AlkD